MEKIKNWYMNINNRESVWIFIFSILIILYFVLSRKPSCSSLYKGDWSMIEGCQEERDYESETRTDSYRP